MRTGCNIVYDTIFNIKTTRMLKMLPCPYFTVCYNTPGQIMGFRQAIFKKKIVFSYALHTSLMYTVPNTIPERQIPTFSGLASAFYPVFTIPDSTTQTII
ncbi:hypothetical protein SAMN02927921_04215 [Sinomicrobium oceani]|uniref:Uncharacterized protein n=2 Tax=Sinomicrobium oceani TaxID=1150368 RepID=A0A1K1RZP2_9FLAO|nr:hypothetical protein SAMN02927921_04215 [Sinomicrobium oceani]